MLFPSIFSNSMLDDFMGFPFERSAVKPHKQPLMRTDVKELENEYALTIELPGYKKEDVSMKLDKGYLTVSAATKSEKEEKDDEGKYVLRERFAGNCSRSFFIGEDIEQEDIHASFADGVLSVTIPKEAKQKVEEAKYIAIE